jgi:hypothetical protein
VRIVHENIKDFQCGVCEAGFATVSGVKRHLVHHHNLGRRLDKAIPVMVVQGAVF